MPLLIKLSSRMFGWVARRPRLSGSALGVAAACGALVVVAAGGGNSLLARGIGQRLGADSLYYRPARSHGRSMGPSATQPRRPRLSKSAIERIVNKYQHTCVATAVDRGNWSVYGANDLHSNVDPAPVPAAGVLYEEWTTPPLDGAVYAEPLVVDGCLIVATENDTVYAFDAFSGALRWRVHLAAPVPASTLPCGDIAPVTGITGTPAYDPNDGLVWVVYYTQSKSGPEHVLAAIRPTTGAVVARVPLPTPRSEAAAMQQRGALVISRGNVYVPFGGLFGDCSNYHGTVLSVGEATHKVQAWVAPTARGAGVWSPAGVDVLSNGSVVFADGNGAARAGQRFDGSNAVYLLSSSLRLEGYFAPRNWAQLNSSDLDLGSTSPAVLSAGLLFQVGKQGVGYLLSLHHLTGVGSQLAEGRVCRSGGAFGGDAVAGNVVYVPCQGGLTAVRVGAGGFRVMWTSNAVSPGTPVVAGGKVWVVTTDGELAGIAPASGRVVQTMQLSLPATHFPWLVAVGGSMYAPDGNRVMNLSGL
jgi:polyvinyl alcohol dehydrogenase (cytochrome)